MAIRNFCNVPDEHVPRWVLESRERERAAALKYCSCGLHFPRRNELLTHCDATGHRPDRPYAADPYLARL